MKTRIGGGLGALGLEEDEAGRTIFEIDGNERILDEMKRLRIYGGLG